MFPMPEKFSIARNPGQSGERSDVGGPYRVIDGNPPPFGIRVQHEFPLELAGDGIDGVAARLELDSTYLCGERKMDHGGLVGPQPPGLTERDQTSLHRAISR